MENNRIIRLAVLIDADNISASVIEGLLSEITHLGETTIKRIYGDFFSTHSTSWREILNRYAIQPVQQFANSKGKNASDIALIIDAMDLLHMGRLDGFCLVSSDSDFTRLASRIREDGLRVYGFGAQKTPEAFQRACNKFTFIEVSNKTESQPTKNTLTGVTPENHPIEEKTATKKTSSKSAPAKNNITPHDKTISSYPPIPFDLIQEAIQNSSGDSGIARLGAIGTTLLRLQPDFAVRTYGFKKLTDLFKANPDIYKMPDVQSVQLRKK